MVTSTSGEYATHRVAQRPVFPPTSSNVLGLFRKTISNARSKELSE
jgi:hypothetical protein